MLSEICLKTDKFGEQRRGRRTRDEQDGSMCEQ